MGVGESSGSRTRASNKVPPSSLGPAYAPRRFTVHFALPGGFRLSQNLQSRPLGELVRPASWGWSAPRGRSRSGSGNLLERPETGTQSRRSQGKPHRHKGCRECPRSLSKTRRPAEHPQLGGDAASYREGFGNHGRIHGNPHLQTGRQDGQIRNAGLPAYPSRGRPRHNLQPPGKPLRGNDFSQEPHPPYGWTRGSVLPGRQLGAKRKNPSPVLSRNHRGQPPARPHWAKGLAGRRYRVKGWELGKPRAPQRHSRRKVSRNHRIRCRRQGTQRHRGQPHLQRVGQWNPGDRRCHHPKQPDFQLQGERHLLTRPPERRGGEPEDCPQHRTKRRKNSPAYRRPGQGEIFGPGPGRQQCILCRSGHADSRQQLHHFLGQCRARERIGRETGAEGMEWPWSQEPRPDRRPLSHARIDSNRGSDAEALRRTGF